VDMFKDIRMRQNPRNRCYLCKRQMFTVLKKEAKRFGITMVADGTTVSDLSENRPGRLALEKLDIASPLKDAGFNGPEIIAELKKCGVADYFLTSSTCLATRFPYDLPLDPAKIEAIGRVEHDLLKQGIFPLRVRYMTDGVRIETTEANFRKVMALKKDLLALCKTHHFKFVTLDLGGIKSGSWDELPALADPATD
jgi:pyridinium-3,5-biscarboxylic acid mononucleotide sulfurtransferase